MMNDNPSEYETYVEVDERFEDIASVILKARMIETCEDELAEHFGVSKDKLNNDTVEVIFEPREVKVIFRYTPKE